MLRPTVPAGDVAAAASTDVAVVGVAVAATDVAAAAVSNVAAGRLHCRPTPPSLPPPTAPAGNVAAAAFSDGTG